MWPADILIEVPRNDSKEIMSYERDQNDRGMGYKTIDVSMQKDGLPDWLAKLH